MNAIVSKICHKCYKEKPIGAFHKRNRGKNGFDSICKQYEKEYSAKYYQKNRREQSDRNKKWRNKNKEWLIIYDRARKYGLSSEQYKELFQKQNGKCAICSLEFSDKERCTTPVIDHNHATSEVRGLLCFRCNTAIGIIETFPQLNSIFKYLRLPINAEGKLSERYTK